MTDHLSAVLLVIVTYVGFVAFMALFGRALKLQGPVAQPLDVLRGLSASLVMISHLVRVHAVFEEGGASNYDPTMYFLVELGTVGVGVFFLITGFLFGGPAYPASESGATVSRQFLVKRWRRLAPSFYVFAALVFVFHASYIYGTGQAVGLTHYAEAFARIFSFGALLGNEWSTNPYLMHAAGMSWSLAYEWVFYGAVAIAVYRDQTQWVPTLMLIWWVGAWLLTGELNPWPALFVIGWVYHRFSSTALRNMVILATSYALIGNSGLLTAALFLFFCQIKQWPQWLSLFATAGHVTYSYYLIHGLCQLLAYVLVREWLIPKDLNTPDIYVFGVISALISAGAAALMYRYLEMPYFQRRDSSDKSRRGAVYTASSLT